MSVILVLIPIAIAAAGTIKVISETKDSANVLCITSKMKDEELLQTALEQYGCKSVSLENKINFSLEDTRVVFQRNETGVLEALFFGGIKNEQAVDFVNDIQSEYLRLVQEMIYNKLLERAKEKGLVLESEAIQPDNTVVLTFAVN